MIQITECPRDAMQGIHEFIPTQTKIEYLKSLIASGFPIIDAGSFVSPKAIPQMADSSQVFEALGEVPKTTKLLAIVANARGAEDAAAFDNITYLGFPFSISETFQKRNTNASIEESLARVEDILTIASKNSKTLLVYLSMAFGNPYGDEWSPELVTKWAQKLSSLGIKNIALADTTGVSDVGRITSLFSTIIPELGDSRIIAHLHSTPQDVSAKIKAAYNAGCRNFDSAIKGYGGCPMASDDLTGNMDTETILDWAKNQNITTGINEEEFSKALVKADQIFKRYH
ncbi:MAG: hydroxymethylglutaryl-CoA lyase [Bacteroidia bacterium]